VHDERAGPASAVGDEHAEVRRTLRELGYRHWYVFERRRRIAVPL